MPVCKLGHIFEEAYFLATIYTAVDNSPETHISHRRLNCCNTAMRALVKLLPLWALLSGLERGDGEGGSAELAALLTQQKGLSSDEVQQRVQVLMQESKHQSDLHSATQNASSWTNVELEPNGKIKPLAKLSGRMYFNHIAKCSGGSAIEQIKDIVKNAKKNADQAMVFEGREECYGYTRLSRFGPGKAKVDHYLTMLRSPRHQVGKRNNS